MPIRLEDFARFVIQQHTRLDDIHWDLMLESGGSLITWRVDIGPDKLLHNVASTVRIADHELKFLTYQGPVNKGEGSVEIAAAGTYELLSNDDEHICVDLAGKELTGKFKFTLIQGQSWTLELMA